MTEGKAAHVGATRKAHTWQSGLNSGERVDSCDPAAQPPKHREESVTTRIPGPLSNNMMRGSETRSSRRSHTPEDVGSNPTPASNKANDTRSKSLACPQCGSIQLYKDGLRYSRSNGDPVQRWLCRNCGYRFSETRLNSSNVSEHVQNLPRQILNYIGAIPSSRQVCVLAEDSKNLAISETRFGTAQRESTRDLPGTLLDYAWKMKKRNLAEETIKHRIYRLNVLIRKGADLWNPDSVETILATEPWKPANKSFFVRAYQSFTKTYSIPWIPIRVTYESKQPFIPLETEIDQLIAKCGKRTATFLQVLKDTGARCGEIKNLKWTDVDEPKRAIRINDPEKGSNSRTVQVTPKTIAMLNALPKRSIYVFSPVGTEKPPRIRSMQSIFARQRNNLAVKLQNPRLKQIHFHTLRHWKATMEYARTRDILRVKQLLGHKRLETTEIYTHLVDFATEDYTVRRPKTSKEEDEFIEAGFEYVRYDEKEQCPIYRKRK